MSAREKDHDQEQQAGLASVGARLAEVRQQQQRSVESIASDLRLAPQTVQAIESGDEARLPAATFLRGYVKSYARLLDIDSAPLVAQLPSVEGQRPAALKRVGMRRSGVTLPVGKWLLPVSMLAGVVLIVVYGVPAVERLWSARSEDPVSDQLQLPATAVQDDTAPVPLQQVEQAPALPAPPADDTAEAASEASTGVAELPPVSEPAPPAQEPPGQASAPVAVDQPQPAGPAVIKLRFNEDSWVEMEANGRKLVVGTQAAGSERTVRAEPPVQLLIGNAPGVELSYRGEPVDMTPYQRGKVARFTLEN